MPLEPTDFYRTHLVQRHQRLLAHPITRAHLSGRDIRLDGVPLRADAHFNLPFGIFSTLEFTHLFSVFDGSRVHRQAEKLPSSDGAPPGLYFTIVNHRVLESRHKNRLGIYRRALPAVGDIGSAMHIDHYHLKTRHTPATLGAQAFTLCAITAHLAGMDRITLVAADGQAGMQRYVGARVWPKFGFDAPLQDDETAGAGHLAGCSTVQDVMARDETWWDRHGTQRFMAFDLTPNSVSWRKLLRYLDRKLFQGNRP